VGQGQHLFGSAFREAKYEKLAVPFGQNPNFFDENPDFEF